MSLSRQIASFVADLRYDDLPPAVVDRAKGVILQALDSALIGQAMPASRQALALMQQPHWDDALLKELSQAMMDASICGLGQAAPNPALTVMKYFRQEVQ